MEFKKVLKDYRMKVEEGEAEILFKHFDSDKSGEIDYDEFLRGVVVLLLL